MSIKSVMAHYPLWKHSFFGWLAPALLVAVFTPIVVIYGTAEDKLVADIITILAGAGVFGICVAGVVIQLVARWGVLRSVIAARDYGTRRVPMPIAYRAHPNILEEDEIDVYDFCLRLADEISFILNLANAYKARYPLGYNARWSQPIVFVTLKQEGTVSFWDRFAKTVRRVRGFQRGNWIEVEWTGDEEHTRRLIRHELAHVLCSAGGLGATTQQQHDIIKEVGP